MVNTVTPAEYRATMAARAQRQEEEAARQRAADEASQRESSAGTDAAAAAAATSDDVAMESDGGSPDSKLPATSNVAGAKTQDAQGAASTTDAAKRGGEDTSPRKTSKARSSVSGAGTEQVVYSGEDDDKLFSSSDDDSDRGPRDRYGKPRSPCGSATSHGEPPGSYYPGGKSYDGSSFTSVPTLSQTYSPPYSLASELEEGEERVLGRDDRGRGGGGSHGRKDRGRGTVVTNVTQADEDRQRRRSEPELRPWMPSRAEIARMEGASSRHWELALFDPGPLRRDPVVVGLGLSPEEHRRWLMEQFFRSRFYHNRGRTVDLISALIQAWNQFVSNAMSTGLATWLERLDNHRVKFEEHSETGMRMRVHRLSREAGLPCFTWDTCPQCVPQAEHAPHEAFVDPDHELYQRVPSQLWEAIRALSAAQERAVERAAAQRDDAAASRGAGGPRRTTRRDQGRPGAAPLAAPSYPPTADSRANERDNSFEYRPADPYDSAGAPRSTAGYRGSPPAGAAAAGRSPPHAGLQRELTDLRQRLADERSSRLELALLAQQLRADLAEFRAAAADDHRRLDRAESELSALTEDHKRVLGMLRSAGILARKKPRTDDTDEGGRRKT